MKTFAGNEKQPMTAVRNARSYIHHPADSVHQAHQTEVRRILRSTGVSHTIHQPNNRTLIQRVPIVRTNHTISEYEFTGTTQRRTNQNVSMGMVDLSYDPDTGIFECTYKLNWQFPGTWNQARRTAYIAEFGRRVSQIWSNRYTLVEYSGTGRSARPTGRTARVQISFNNNELPDFANATEHTRWLIEQPLSVRQRWRMEVNPAEIREEVRSPVVELDPSSMRSQERDVSRYNRYGRPPEGVYTQENLERHRNPPYGHYQSAGVSIRNRRSNTQQMPAAHEFGHMIGLADEYVLSRSDYDVLVRTMGRERAQQELRRRRTVTASIMNIGGSIRRDHYQPFADWLNSLTPDTNWRVGNRVRSR